jgi:hypothetical protein
MLPNVNMIWMAILWSVGLAVFCISLWMLFSLFGGQSHTNDSTNNSTEKILERRLTAGEKSTRTNTNTEVKQCRKPNARHEIHLKMRDQTITVTLAVARRSVH